MSSEPLTAGKKSAKTKGPKKLAEAGHEAASTRTIRKALNRLAAVSIELEAIQELLAKVETKEKRGKRTTRSR